MSDHLKRAKEHLNQLTVLDLLDPPAAVVGAALWAILAHLEQQEAALQETPQSAISFAALDGRVLKQWPWHGANPDSSLTLSALMEATSDFFRSTLSIPAELAATFRDSSTLELTLRWPTPSTGTTTVGGLGRAAQAETVTNSYYPESPQEPGEGE